MCRASPSASGLAVGNNELQILPGGDFDRLDIIAGRWDAATYEIFQYDWRAPLSGRIVWSRGWLGHVMPTTSISPLNFAI